MSRQTSTGKVLEEMVLAALNRGRYVAAEQVVIGLRPTGHKHVVDIVAHAVNGKKYIVSLKWQQTSGTAEQKIPFEVICLKHAIITSDGEFTHAYLVLGGEGWSMRDFYTSGRLEQYLPYREYVTIASLEGFVGRANQGRL